MTEIPIQKPITTHFLASAAASAAPSTSPAKNLDSTLEALMMPTMPKGRQQKMVTRMDSTNQFLGGWVCMGWSNILKIRLKIDSFIRAK